MRANASLKCLEKQTLLGSVWQAFTRAQSLLSAGQQSGAATGMRANTRSLIAPQLVWGALARRQSAARAARPTYSRQAQIVPLLARRSNANTHTHRLRAAHSRTRCGPHWSGAAAVEGRQAGGRAGANSEEIACPRECFEYSVVELT